MSHVSFFCSRLRESPVRKISLSSFRWRVESGLKNWRFFNPAEKTARTFAACGSGRMDVSMVFSSLIFLYLFLPVCLILYFLARKMKVKNIILLVLSLLFYAWGEPVWVTLLIFSGFVDYFNGRIIEANRGTKYAKMALIASIVINLGLLGVFKYSAFFIQSINGLFSAHLPFAEFALPIGISFYTFQTLSYTIDVYRGNTKAQKKFSSFLLYVSLFPQLIAGPIVRYTDVAEQIDNRTTTLSGFKNGAIRFLTGLAKKVLIANYAGSVCQQLLSSNLSELTTAGAWFGIFLFAIQIYFDFSGYSDMAIGLGKIFGFTYPENFNYPYICTSITDFWRRWHISLSSFFRDYVYIPLGGNRRHLVLNLLIVWSLTGLWHGASWNFVLWGLYYFVFLFFEKVILKGKMEQMPWYVKRPYSLLVVLIGWAFFYFTDLGQLGTFFQSFFFASPNGLIDTTSQTIIINNSLFAVIAVIACLPLSKYVKKLVNYVGQQKGNAGMAVQFSLNFVYMAGVLFFCTASLVGQSYNPFLYFRF